MVFRKIMLKLDGFCSMQRFFVDTDAFDGKRVIIKGDDAFHISRSLRMKKSEQITVCLPDKTVLLCSISDFLPDTVVADVISSTACDSESPCRIHVYQALPKSDKLETVVQKAVECGAYSITPFLSERCIAKPGDSFERKLERLNRISLEAAKQCGRGLVPKVEPILSFSEMLNEASHFDLPLFCYEADGTKPIGTLLKKNVTDIAVIVGSEGGFSASEAEEAANSGMLMCGLGKRILRTETAPLFVLSCLSLYYELGI